MHQYLVVRHFVQRGGAHAELRPEPTARLVVGLHDEVGGPQFLEVVRVARVVERSPRRDGGIQPDVEHVRNARVRRPVLRDGQVINGRSVEVDVLGVHVLVNCLGEFLAASDDDHVAHVTRPIFGCPDGYRNAPVALARDVPVRRVLHEVAEAFVAGLLWVPLAVLDVVQQFLLDVRHRDEPLVGDDLQDARVTPPTVSVTVVDGAGREQVAVGFEVGHDVLVGVLDELPLVRARFRAVHAITADGTEDVEAEFLAPVEVLLTVAGRGVDESGTVPVHFDVVGLVHLQCPFAAGVVRHLVVEGWSYSHPTSSSPVSSFTTS